MSHLVRLPHAFGSTIPLDKRLAMLLLFLSLTLVACMTQSATPEPGSGAPTTAETESADDAFALSWQSYARLGDEGVGVGEGGSIDECKSLLLDADGQAYVGACGADARPVSLFPHRAEEWAEFQARFAPFTLTTETDRLVFQGTGEAASPAWQRAIMAWAQFAYGEATSERVSAAAGGTVLSWFLGELPGQPDLCQHLTVQVFGHVSAEHVPCSGGPTQAAVADWLTDEEWERFDTLLYQRAALYQDNNYFSGMGGENLSEAEIIELESWAQAVYDRLATQLGEQAATSDNGG